jgi:aromatic ring-opening dioxygenase LigB subunit
MQETIRVIQLNEKQLHEEIIRRFSWNVNNVSRRFNDNCRMNASLDVS